MSEYPVTKPQFIAPSCVNLSTYIQGMSDYEVICYFSQLIQQWAIEWGQTQQDWKTQQEAFESFKGYVNTEIEDFENNITGKYTELKNYVDTYFENLDVQQEINNKLDEMEADGSLDKIINQKIFAPLEPFISVANYKTNSNTWEDAIEAACAATSSNSYCVVMPTGSYAISRTVNIASPVKKVYFGGATFTEGESLRNSVMFNITAPYVEIEGLTISGDKDNNNIAISYSSYMSIIRHCRITGVGTAFFIKGAVASTYEQIYIANTSKGVHFESVSETPYSINTCQFFRGVLFYGCENALFSSTVAAGLPATALTLFDSCIFEHNTNTNSNANNIGINLLFSNCWFEANTNKTVASSTPFINCNFQSSDAGIDYNIPGYNRNVIISNNNVLAGEFRLQSYGGGRDSDSYVSLSVKSFSSDSYKLHPSAGGNIIPLMKPRFNGLQYYGMFYLGINTKSDGSVPIVTNLPDTYSVTRNGVGDYTVSCSDPYSGLFPAGAVSGNVGPSQSGYDVRIAPFQTDPATYRDYMATNQLRIYVTNNGEPVDGKVWITGFCSLDD